MIRLASIIDTFESPLLAKYANGLLPSHRQALGAMKQCRNALSRRMQVQCIAYDEQLFVPHSCGHRSCPHCQHHESQQWLERQLKKQVPAELRALAWTHQRTLYALMMQCSWETVRTFSLNDKQLQGTPGAVAVLHTHSRRLDYHPHIHLAMPAAAMSQNIIACGKGQVTFRYQNSKTRKRETRTLAGADFLWLLLRHVLPKGVRRARNFGFLHPNSKRLIQLLHYLLKIDPGRSMSWLRKRPPLTCRCCGGEMKIVRTRIPPPIPRRLPPDAAAVAMAM